MRIGRAVLLCLVCATSALAQDSLHLREGQRVRVSSRAATAPETGALIALAVDTLVLRADRNGDTHRILRADIVALDTSRGEGHRGPDGLQGALLGLAVGALAGNVVGDMIVKHDRARGDCPDGDCELVKVLTVPFGTVFGFAVGGVVGSQLHAEQWGSVALAGQEVSGTPHAHAFIVTFHAQVPWLGR